MFPLRKKNLKTTETLTPDRKSLPRAAPYGPLDADGREEADPDEVASHGREGPEEVLSGVGLLQGEVLVGLQAGGHLRLRVGVTLMQRLLPKVLVLEKKQDDKNDRIHSHDFPIKLQSYDSFMNG